MFSVEHGFEISNVIPSNVAALLNTINIIMGTVIISKAYALGEERLVASQQTPPETTS